MPCRTVHLNTGTAVGILACCTFNNQSKEYNLYDNTTLILAGALGGLLPDILEPATSPHHRKLFHSWVAFGGVAYVIKKLLDWEPCDLSEKILKKALIVLAFGYLSHLALDALTKKSLPII